MFEQRRRVFRSVVALVGLGAIAGCKTKTPSYLDSQVLDRPTDMALVCAHLQCASPDAQGNVDPKSCTTLLDPMDTCVTPAQSNCDFSINEGGFSRAQLFGFVTSSGRNELGLVSTCKGEVLDTQLALPGLNSLPVGKMPSKVASSQDSCRVVTANAGSCDFSVVNTTPFVAMGLGLREGQADASAPDVTTLTPQRLNPDSGKWEALGVSASDVQFVPASVLGQTINKDGQSCDANRPYRAYALFPSCDLLAEIDLKSGQILQSLQWQKNGDDVSVVSTGQSPQCPFVDCASEATTQSGNVNLARLSLRSLALVSDFEDKGNVSAALYVGGLGRGEVYEVRVQSAGGKFMADPRSIALFGDTGVSRIRVSPSFAPNGGAQTSKVDCAQLPSDKNAKGLTRFAYVIASDGSTRVLQLDALAEGSSMGQECNTQKDPVALERDGQSRCLCVPLVEAPEGQDPSNANAFRWLAQGPGIRAQNPVERAMDWAFVPANSFLGRGLIQIRPPKEEPLLNYGFEGMMAAVGMTSRGRFMMTSFGQYQRRLDFPGAGLASVRTLEERAIRRVNTSKEEQDPDLGNAWRPVLDRFSTLSFGLGPHALHSFGSLSPLTVQDGQASSIGVPMVGDSRQQVSGLVRADPVAVLSPSLRRIDLAYADPAAKVSVQGAAGNPMMPLILNDRGEVAKLADGLGKDARGQWGFYTQDALRVVTRDYRSWPSAQFELAWEGVVGTARSVQGRLECDQPSADQSLCESASAEGLVFADDSLDFCQRGVLAGDTLRIGSCRQDADCGSEQACLKRSSNANEQPGICVSALAFDQQKDELRRACANFLYNPCGEPSLEFDIVKASAHRLALKPLPLPERSHWATSDSCPAGGRNNHLESGVCVCDPDMVPCGDPLVVGPAGQTLALDCGRPSPDKKSCVDEGREENSGHEVVDRFVCQEIQPEGGCSADPDCDDLRLSKQRRGELSVAGQRAAARYCIAGQCRRPCLTAQDAQALTPRDKEIIQSAPGAGETTAATLAGQRCIRQVAPGPRCFAELLRYQVRARNAFVLTSSDERLNFFGDNVERDPNTQECKPTTQSGEGRSLLHSRIPLPKSQSEFEAQFPVCEGTSLPSLSSPFACRETTIRQAGPQARVENRFHTFAYRRLDQVVPSLRISNPIFSLNLDLTSLSGLSQRVPGQTVRWPAKVVPFLRSRIPSGYAIRFEIGRQGYRVITERPRLGKQGGNSVSPLVFPTALVQNPAAPSSIFAIDSVALGSAALGARGQVMHLRVKGQDQNIVAVDANFDQVQ